MTDYCARSLRRVTVLVLLVPAPLFAQDAPSYLPRDLRSTFETWTKQPTHRAFALSRTGAWGSAYGHDSLAAAREAALANCRGYASACVIIAEDGAIVRAEYPFPPSTEENPFLTELKHLSSGTVFLLTLGALLLLLVGTIVAERHPLFLFETWLSDIWKLRMNYTLMPFGFAYFLLMLPLFFRLGQRDFTNPLTWLVFAAPILPYVASVLYLRKKEKLSDRFELK